MHGWLVLSSVNMMSVSALPHRLNVMRLRITGNGDHDVIGASRLRHVVARLRARIFDQKGRHSTVTRLPYLIVALIILCTEVHGQVFLHSETSSGDLSDDYLTPTTLSLSEGVGFLEVSVNEFERDLFTLIIPLGIQLDAIIPRNYESNNAANQSFFGFQENRLTLSTFPSNGFPDPINFALVGTDDLNSDLLPGMVSSNMSLSAPVQSGNHAFWINETGIESTMTFEFQSSEVVPEPVSSVLILLGLTFASLRRIRPLD